MQIYVYAYAFFTFFLGDPNRASNAPDLCQVYWKYSCVSLQYLYLDSSPSCCLQGLRKVY